MWISIISSLKAVSQMELKLLIRSSFHILCYDDLDLKKTNRGLVLNKGYYSKRFAGCQPNENNSAEMVLNSRLP